MFHNQTHKEKTRRVARATITRKKKLRNSLFQTMSTPTESLSNATPATQQQSPPSRPPPTSETQPLQQEKAQQLATDKKRPREEENVSTDTNDNNQLGGIPFQRPFDNPNYWTGGSRPDTMAALRKLDKTMAEARLPTGKQWEHYSMEDQFALRSAGLMTIADWAKMGFWQKNQFGLLYALSARVPDFSIVAFWCSSTSEMAVVAKKESEIFVETAAGTSKTKAKQFVAEKLIRSAAIWEWIQTKYRNTMADRYLNGGESSSEDGNADDDDDGYDSPGSRYGPGYYDNGQ